MRVSHNTAVSPFIENGETVIPFAPNAITPRTKREWTTGRAPSQRFFIKKVRYHCDAYGSNNAPTEPKEDYFASNRNGRVVRSQSNVFLSPMGWSHGLSR